MVSSYVILKLFNKATSDRRQNNRERNETLSGSLSITTQRENNTNKCRICLKEGTVPIYNDLGDVMAVDISTFGGIDLSEDDESLHFMCDPCSKLLEAAILFRKTAKKTDQILKNIAAKNTKLSIESKGSSTQEKVEDNSESSTLVIQSYFSSVASNIGDAEESLTVKPIKKIPKVQCRVCFKVITKSYYKEHFALHDHTAAKYVCDICGKSFRQRCSYRKHYFTHSSEFPWKCKLCPYRGRHSGLLKTHMHVHTGDYRFMCTECPARFLTKSNLNKHSLKHKEPLFKCDTCQRGFHSKLNLERHFEADHLGIKNHICHVCGKAFGYRKAMMRHQLDVHKREKKVNGRTPAYIEAELKNLDSFL
ncbi:zinc finger protein 454-like [Trichoplusia ni]|uniref:Zinc finger protein 454-like n=1 Tax=Trichoplusia ni TaxID=7111 RepID=A0A7E5VLX9_TRINI|nr:zinc finger protein 454-like [Trichoplusia ni]